MIVDWPVAGILDDQIAYHRRRSAELLARARAERAAHPDHRATVCALVHNARVHTHMAIRFRRHARQQPALFDMEMFT